MKTRNQYLAIFALLGIGTAYGAPTVNGQVISWPDDGWYQVQTADTYVQICAGTRSCEVAPGTYNVINHTTGERFTNIEVVANPGTEPGGSPVVITGNVISWPDDGWYQVQTADTYVQICAGTRSCEVAAGTYNVINHTTGERFTNIEVTADPTTEPGDSPIVITGNVISWPDDGWYQVQDADTYVEICGGGRSCTVEAGIYNVINHSTGERFTDIAVNGETGDNEPPVYSAVNLLDISQDLIVTAAGYQLDQLAVTADDLAFIVGQQTTIVWPDEDYYQVQKIEDYTSVCNGGAECKILPGSYVVINHSTGERTPLTVPYVSPEDQPEATQLAETSATFVLRDYPSIVSTVMNIGRTHYNCENGGSMIREEGFKPGGVFYDAFGSVVGGVQVKSGYLFDQCQMIVRNGLIPDGAYVIQGSVQTELIYSYGDYQSNYDFDEFSIIGDNGLEYRVQGQSIDIDGYDFNYLRSATIAEYQKTSPDGQADELISDVEFNYETLNNTTVLADPWKTLNVNGVVQNAQTGNQRVDINTGTVLTWGSDPFIPFNGSIEMQAEDGSFLYQNANPSVDPDDFWALFADFDYTAANGEQTQLLMESYTFPFGYGSPSCFQYRSDQTGRLECPDAYLQ